MLWLWEESWDGVRGTGWSCWVLLLQRPTEVGVAVLRKKITWETFLWERKSYINITSDEYYELTRPEEKIFTVLVVLKISWFSPTIFGRGVDVDDDVWLVVKVLVCLSHCRCRRVWNKNYMRGWSRKRLCFLCCRHDSWSGLLKTFVRVSYKLTERNVRHFENTIVC